MSFKILSIGDYMTGENVHHYRRGIPKLFKGEYNSLISKKVKKIIQDGDLLLLNFESSLSDDDILPHLPIEQSVYVAPLETLKLLESLEIPIIANIANNHFGQHGPEVVKYTMERLTEHKVMIVGINNSPLTLSLQGMELKIWGVSLVNDKMHNNLYFMSNYENLIHDLHLENKKENELRIISIHWGNEYLTLPSKTQFKLANDLVTNGFDLILGHHPHIIQPIKKIKDSWVIFSHGNFIFDQNFSDLTQKGLLTCFTFPEKVGEFYISQQKHFKVVDLTKSSRNDIEKFCNENYSEYLPLKMRVKMKLELLLRFYELNLSILLAFGKNILRN